MNSILNRIAQYKLQEVAVAKERLPVTKLLRPAQLIQNDFIQAMISASKPAIIAEIKKASPSKGVIREYFDVAKIATSYAQHGACCLSVLTDREFFQGDPAYVSQAKLASNLPILRKDFIIDSYQIHESWSLGADCILLIVALLDDVQLKEFCILAQELDMAVLVESHNQAELERALCLPTPLIGVNNRSLHDFSIDIQLSIQLKPFVPADKILITESGIHTHEDVMLMQAHGIDSFLVGESLMKAVDPGLALSQLKKG
ncbi:MAG: indole-3-glycerol phosphate synthase TrpC [Legionella sp.]|nr:indole-3-glycerol phosphate synthase TrpC [Legionella sp.]